MEKRWVLIIMAALLLLAACNTATEPGSRRSGGETFDPPDIGAVQLSADGVYKSQSFAAAQVDVVGYLQHIEVRPASGDAVVIRWRADEQEQVSVGGGLVRFETQEPKWTRREGPPYTVTSTIYVELPAGTDVASFGSTLGDITIEGVTGYNKLAAKTVDGHVTARGTVGAVTAVTGRGTIGPDNFAGAVRATRYEKNLDITLPGAVNHGQHTLLYTQSGRISINEPVVEVAFTGDATLVATATARHAVGQFAGDRLGGETERAHYYSAIRQLLGEPVQVFAVASGPQGGTGEAALTEAEARTALEALMNLKFQIFEESGNPGTGGAVEVYIETANGAMSIGYRGTWLTVGLSGEDALWLFDMAEGNESLRPVLDLMDAKLPLVKAA